MDLQVPDYYWVFAQRTPDEGTRVRIVRQADLPFDFRSRPEYAGWEVVADSAPSRQAARDWCGDGTYVTADGEPLYGGEHLCRRCRRYAPCDLYRGGRWRTEGSRDRIRPFMGYLCEGCADDEGAGFVNLRRVKGG